MRRLSTIQRSNFLIFIIFDIKSKVILAANIKPYLVAVYILSFSTV